MTDTAAKLSDLLKHALCDCLCTNVDLDLDNASNNNITIHVTPTKDEAADSSGGAVHEHIADENSTTPNTTA